jgi:hypothetical protein
MTTTQHVESLNNFKKKIFKENVILGEFIIRFDETLKKNMRERA